jgi:acyl-CoA thioesterase FadM
VAPVIINASCTFLIPVNYPATVVLRMYGGEPGRSSVMTWYELGVEGDERIYAEGSSKVVWMDPGPASRCRSPRHPRRGKLSSLSANGTGRRAGIRI